MINLLKKASVLIGLSACGVTSAATLFTIVPQATAVTVSSSSSQIYQMSWTITNNTQLTTPIVFNGWGAANSNGLSVISNTCSNPIAPQGTCTFTMGILGQAMTDSLNVSPTFCIPSKQACSQASLNNRLAITWGTWGSYMLNGAPNFPEFVAINYPSLIIGGMNNDYTPEVYQCPTISPNFCSQLGNGLQSFDFNKITELTYGPDGTIYGIFQPFEGGVTPTGSYIMSIPPNGNTWSQFTSALPGDAEWLDISSTYGVLVSSTYVPPGDQPVGAAAIYNNLGVNGSNQNNQSSSGSKAIIDDGLGNIFVAGPAHISGSQTNDLVWLWNINTQTFTQINMPDNIYAITSMASDGKGTIYIAGSDSLSDGHVWSYTAAGREFVDTGLQAEQIVTLFYSPQGYLLAGGNDATAPFNGDVWYYSPITGLWTSLYIPNSSSVVSIAADIEGDIVATGYDLYNNSIVWLFN